MTTKEKAISVINSLDDNATLDEMIDRLYLLRKIELGIAQADAERQSDSHGDRKRGVRLIAFDLAEHRAAYSAGGRKTVQGPAAILAHLFDASGQLASNGIEHRIGFAVSVRHHDCYRFPLYWIASCKLE